MLSPELEQMWNAGMIPGRRKIQDYLKMSMLMNELQRGY